MPYALILAGLMLTIAGVRNTQGALFTLLEGDFTGQRNFIAWALAMVGIGSLGYVADLRKLSNSFMALILIVLFLANGGSGKSGGGVFAQFMAAIKGPIPKAPVAGSTAAQASGSPNDFISGLSSLDPAILKPLPALQ